jgi:hypothetical protein
MAISGLLRKLSIVTVMLKLTIIHKARHNCPHFTDEKTETEKPSVTAAE